MRRLALLAAALLALTACTSDDEPDDGAPAVEPTASSLVACAEQPEAAASGAELMPDVSFACPGGGSFDLGRAQGVPTVVNLWGTWCPPCREEIPLLQEFAEAAGDSVRVVGVISKDGRPQAESFAQDAGITYANAFDGDGQLMAALGLNVLPFTYFLYADGGIAHVKTGPLTSVDELRGLVAEHLGVEL